MEKTIQTKVERYFEGEKYLKESLDLFDLSGFFLNYKVEPVGPYKKLTGVSHLDLYTMRTKFPDAILAVPVETLKKVVKKVVEKELVSV